MSTTKKPGDSPLLPPIPQRQGKDSKDSQPDDIDDSKLPKYAKSCTHSRFTRLWDWDGTRHCAKCKEPTPNIGWLWRCTEDTDGCIPASDFDDNLPKTKTIISVMPVNDVVDNKVAELDPAVIEFLNQGDYTVKELNVVPMLQPSVLKAIGERHYSHAQVKIMIYQKINVQEKIRQDLGGYNPETRRPDYVPPASSPFDIFGNRSRGNDTRPSTATTFSDGTSVFTRSNTFPTSTTMSSRAATDPDVIQEQAELAEDWKGLHESFKSIPYGPPTIPNPYPGLPEAIQNQLRFDIESTPPDAQLLSEVYEFPRLADDFYDRNGPLPSNYQPEKFGRCQYMVCQACFPAAKLRGGDIGAMIHGPMPPIQEMMNRPVSDARKMLNMGLRTWETGAPQPPDKFNWAGLKKEIEEERAAEEKAKKAKEESDKKTKEDEKES